MQYKQIGKYIRKKRTDAGFSLNGFAITNEIDPAILSRIENQQHLPYLPNLPKINQK